MADSSWRMGKKAGVRGRKTEDRGRTTEGRVRRAGQKLISYEADWGRSRRPGGIGL